MIGFVMFAQTSVGKIPSILLPWLAVVLVLVCLWCMIEVILRIRRVGVTKFNLPLVLICLSTVIFLGFGAGAVREIVAAQDFLRALAALSDPSAGTKELTDAMSRATDDDDRLLAFDVYGQAHPETALDWLRNPDNEVLRERPNIKGTLQAREGRLLAARAAEQARFVPTPVPVEDFRTLEGLFKLADTVQPVRVLFAEGRFDTSTLDQERLDEILRQHDASRDGNRIRIRP